jgi:divalent metal cation (Fe/Co/Zn/Cd) transporter
LSLFIIYNWAKTCFENLFRPTGSVVEERIFEKITFLAWRFPPPVNGCKSINAYHAGDGVWVEVDILLDENTPLEVAHDIAETLQYCYEGLPEVDRAFITSGQATENFE